MSIDFVTRGRSVAPWTRLRNPGILATYGDSLAASLTIDTSLKQNYGATSPVNWAIMLNRGLFRLTAANNGNFGGSGQRTDEMLPRLQSVIASGAGTVIIFAGTNDIALSYPTLGTSAQVAFSNVRKMVLALIRAGIQVVIDLPLGSTSWSAAQIAQLYRYHQMLKEFVEKTPMVYIHDASPMVLNAVGSATAITFKANYFYDQTHPNGRGAYYWGKSLLALLQQIIPPLPRITYLGLTDVRDLLYINNGLFTVQTGGTNNIGAALIGGAVPAGFTLYRTGNATVSLSYGTDDGTALDPSLGGKLIMACTFTAAGEVIRLQQDLGITGVAPGRAFDLGCRARVVSGMDSLCAARMHASVSVDGVSRDWYSLLEGASSHYGPDEAYQVDHMITPRLEAGNVVNFVSARHFAVARAAGTAVVELARFGTRSRLAA